MERSLAVHASETSWPVAVGRRPAVDGGRTRPRLDGFSVRGGDDLGLLTLGGGGLTEHGRASSMMFCSSLRRLASLTIRSASPSSARLMPACPFSQSGTNPVTLSNVSQR
jgi:hypothetical protein